MPTLLWEDKFTTGGTWNSSGGTPVIGSSPAPPSGGNSLECNAVGDFVLYNGWTDNNYVRMVLGVWVYLDSLPSGDTRCFKIDAGPSEGWFLIHPVSTVGEFRINSDGTPTITAVFSGASGAMAQDTWYWCQFMYDVSADPWQIQGKNIGTTISNTATAAASNLNSANVTLGNTSGGSAYTVYFGHMKLGVAADDNDWWPTPESVFPSTGVLDTFAGSDENPITTNWTTPLFSGGETLKRASNQLASDGFGAGWYDLGQFGPDCEVFTTVVAKPGTNEVVSLYARLQSPGVASSVDGYQVRYQTLAGTDQALIRRVDNDAATTLGDPINFELTAGDKIGLRCKGDEISLWHLGSGGQWMPLGSRTDSTYQAAGYLGASIQGTSGLLDDFGGGTIPTTRSASFLSGLGW